jgi:uncharacterized protein (TIGR00730 family)
MIAGVSFPAVLPRRENGSRSLGKAGVKKRMDNKALKGTAQSLPSFLTEISETERQFLSDKHERGADLESAVRIFLEFLRGFEFFGDIDRPCVTVFGSARFAPGHHYYEMARQLGTRLARAGYAVMTGGGPGIMEAANRGAREGGGLSLGCNIILPKEQNANPYLDRFIEMNHFFVRKVMLVKYSRAFVVMPGGLGTLDEAFETLTLVQCRKLERFPIVAMGVDFWGHMREFIRGTLVSEETISQEDLELLRVTDSPQEALAYIQGEVAQAATAAGGID